MYLKNIEEKLQTASEVYLVFLVTKEEIQATITLLNKEKIHTFYLVKHIFVAFALSCKIFHNIWTLNR